MRLTQNVGQGNSTAAFFKVLQLSLDGLKVTAES